MRRLTAPRRKCFSLPLFSFKSHSRQFFSFLCTFSQLFTIFLRQANVPQPKDEPEDDIESALNELQISLDGGYPNRAEDITLMPQLNGYLKYLKPRRFTLKGFKTSYFVCKDLQLSSWKSRDDSVNLSIEPTFSINLKGCEVAPEVNIHQGRYEFNNK